MKLLGWIQRKFRQNNSDTTGRDVAPVSACLYCLSGGPSPEERRPKLPPAILRRDLLPTVTEPPELTASILFDGLLHIGTFGSPIIIAENEPPANEDQKKSSAVVNEIAEKEILKTTDSELITISVELEKVIAEEPSDGGRRRRGSLGELFMRSRAAEEGGGGGKREVMMLVDEGIVKAVPARAELSTEMKRMAAAAAAAGKCTRIQAKIQKLHERPKVLAPQILRIFQRKIHPENSIAWKNFTKPAKNEIKRDHKLRRDNQSCRNPKNDCGRQVLFPKMADSRAIFMNNSTASREKWIKTDADYLVLEL